MKSTFILPLFFFVGYCPVFGQGIPAFSTTFWSLSSNGVERFEILGSSILSDGVILPDFAGGYSLAFANNLDGPFSPTFYTSGPDNRAKYYDGSGWVSTADSTYCLPLNGGGYGEYLYFQNNIQGQSCIERYDGNDYTAIYQVSEPQFMVADIAVDNQGNIWSVIGDAFPSSTFIRVFSPSGEIIKDYPFNYDTQSAYGCFLLNGDLYIGFGQGNPTWSNVLLPIHFIGNQAVVGDPIEFSQTASGDLASANPGEPAFLQTAENDAFEWALYPTLASDFVNVAVDLPQGTRLHMSIVDVFGKVVFTDETTVEFSPAKIDVAALLNGVYLLNIQYDSHTAVRKFSKI